MKTITFEFSLSFGNPSNYRLYKWEGDESKDSYNGQLHFFEVADVNGCEQKDINEDCWEKAICQDLCKKHTTIDSFVFDEVENIYGEETMRGTVLVYYKYEK